MLSSRSSTACLLSSGTLSLRIERSTYGRSFFTLKKLCSWAQLQPLSLVGLVYTWATLQDDGAAATGLGAAEVLAAGEAAGLAAGDALVAGLAAAAGIADGLAAVAGDAAAA